MSTGTATMDLGQRGMVLGCCQKKRLEPQDGRLIKVAKSATSQQIVPDYVTISQEACPPEHDLKHSCEVGVPTRSQYVALH